MKIFLNKLTWDRSCVSNILKSDIYLLHENKINKNNIKYPIESGRKHLYLLIVVITTYSNVTGCKIIIKNQETSYILIMCSQTRKLRKVFHSK